MCRNACFAFVACVFFACESGGGAEGGTSAPTTPKTPDHGEVVPNGGDQGNDTAPDTAPGPEDSTVEALPEVDPYAPWPAILEGATSIWHECQSKFEDECREDMNVLKKGAGEISPEGEALMDGMCPGILYAVSGLLDGGPSMCLKEGGKFALCDHCTDPYSACAKPCDYRIATGKVYFKPMDGEPRRCGTPDGIYLGEECTSDAECTQKNSGTGCIVPSQIRAEYHSCRKEPQWNTAVCMDAHFTILRHGE